jgi:glycosyltransferase EpsF
MDIGGAERLIMNAYRAIDRSLCQFDFAVGASRRCYFDREIEHLGGRVFRLNAAPRHNFLKYARGLWRVLRHRGPFLAVHSHVHRFSGLPLTLAWAAGVPVRIAHCHSMSDGQKDSLSRRTYRRLMSNLIERYATHLFACSEDAGSQMFGPGWRARPGSNLIQNGVNLAQFSNLPSKTELRHRLCLPPHGLAVGHVGSFSRPKNHRFLIKVFAEVVKRAPDSMLVLVGDGALRQEVIASIRSAGCGDRILTLGRRDDIPLVLGALDIFVLPSIWEGLPTVLVEAQAAGLPCIASDVVTREADIGIGLLSFMGLAENPAVWATRILEIGLTAGTPPWSTRLESLLRTGFNINETAGALLHTYRGSRTDAPQQRGTTV